MPSVDPVSTTTDNTLQRAEVKPTSDAGRRQYVQTTLDELDEPLR